MKKVKIYGMSLIVACLIISGCGERGIIISTYGEEVSSETDLSSEEEYDLRDESGDKTYLTSEQEPLITVYVCGKVVREGVYELPEGSRVNDAVEAAGGAAEDVAPGQVNLARIISDGERIYIPGQDEVTEFTEDRDETESGKTGTGLININTAGKAELVTLPGIGESRAEEIIRYREEHGGFKSVEELMNISGIGEKTFEKLRSLITT